MRSLLMIAPILLGASNALAEDDAARCQDAARVPADVRGPTPIAEARISAAVCTAALGMTGLTVTDDDASMQLLEIAAGPAIATLTDVGRDAAPAVQIVAAHARADLRLGMVARMRASIPPLGNDASARRHARLEARLGPWIDAARVDLGQALAIAQAHPGHLRN